MSDQAKIFDPERIELEAKLSAFGKPGINGDLDALTDSTGGTANGTVADVSTAVTGVDGTGNNAASKADVDTRLTGINDNFADLVAKINALLEARNPVWEVAGTNMTSALATLDANGGIKLATAGASADQAILQAQINAAQSLFNVAGLFGTENEPRFKAKIKTGSAITAATIWMGLKLTNTPAQATDDDQVYFSYKAGTNGGRWELLYSIGGTDYSFDSGIAVAVDTVYDLEIRVGSDRKPQGFINGKPLRAFPFLALTDAVDLKPYIGIQADAAAAKHFFVLGEPQLSRKAA